MAGIILLYAMATLMAVAFMYHVYMERMSRPKPDKEQRRREVHADIVRLEHELDVGNHVVRSTLGECPHCPVQINEDGYDLGDMYKAERVAEAEWSERNRQVRRILATPPPLKLDTPEYDWVPR